MSASKNVLTPHHKTGRRREAGLSGLTILLLACFLVLPLNTVQAAVFGGYSEYYIPGPEDEIWNIQVDIDNEAGTPLYLDNTNDRMHSIISITASGDNTVVYYDHWENGYGLILMGF